MKEIELERIRKDYRNRDDSITFTKYNKLNPDYLFLIQNREKELLRIFKNEKYTNFDNCKVLEIGCGYNGIINEIFHLGAKRSNLFGIDLSSERIKILRDHINNTKTHDVNSEVADLKVGSADNLPWESNKFDVVIMSLVLSNIFNNDLKQAICTEVLRVLNKNGFIIWYDIAVNNPANKSVRGINKKEIFKLFLGQKIILNRITCAPPITRRIAKYSWLLLYILEKIKILNTHYLGVIKKSD